MSTYSETSVKLIRDAKKIADTSTIFPYREELIRDILIEIRHLAQTFPALLEERNAALRTGNDDLAASRQIALTMHSLSLKRSKQCLLAYTRTRADCLSDALWELGGATGGAPSRLPQELKKNLSPVELEFVAKYSECISSYRGAFLDVDLGAALIPPKDLFVEVRVLKDCGEVMTESGPVRLMKDTQHYLKRTDVEGFITAGFLKHVD
ncbi:DNA replication protein psf1 [Rhizophlyctis rosea]|uniref:DNA replication complex GINS protein PSF1 n=1 Tax=Rhizophlyctis rosea TaxID=64517 RepID=A0AAD5X5G2_9FUNG|nr:DNA replication protein psf1 [Rhizophlyctis rosea]